MKPVSPVLPGVDLEETVYARYQEQYLSLPALRLADPEATILTRWRLSWRERWTILWTGNLYLWILTFGQPLQPLRPTVERPNVGIDPGAAE